MTSLANQTALNADGFLLVPSIVGPDPLASLATLLEGLKPGCGLRNLLRDCPEVATLAQRLKHLAKPVLGEGAFPVRGLFFDKIPGANWEVNWHQDLSIAVAERVENAARAGAYGDVWTFIALDADTKLIPSFIVGKRDAYHAKAFIADLASRVTKRVQLSSDSLKAYADAVERGFGADVDYGQISKTYSVTNLNKDAASRYSPAEVVAIEKTVVQGMPDVNHISTSHVEKQNHTLRMHCRRLTRLTNAFSKKLENFEAAVALNFVYYNFVKTHGALRCTPCQAAGVEQSAWTVAELVERCGE